YPGREKGRPQKTMACPTELERYFGAELDEAAAAGAVDTGAAADRSGHVAKCGAGEGILRIGEPCLIEQVQSFRAEVHLHALGDAEHPSDVGVDPHHAGADHDV